MHQPNVQKKHRHAAAGVALATFMLAGCQTTTAQQAAVQSPAYVPDAYPGYYPTPTPAPAAAPQAMQAPMAYVPGASVPQMAALEGTIGKIEERLQRVEKAMLRLDRRMQLVERNELNRMSEDTGPAQRTSSNLAPDGFGAVPVSGAYAEGFQPVSTAITSGLQAAPSPAALNRAAGFQLASLASAAEPAGSGLASLADDRPADTRESADGELAIWAVRFENSNVWPDRNQLPGSRDVVSALRSGDPVTVFARGKQPNAVLFRDRVKALSRYLGKVSGKDSVPIAALPGTHLDDATIEIFATY